MKEQKTEESRNLQTTIDLSKTRSARVTPLFLICNCYSNHNPRSALTLKEISSGFTEPALVNKLINNREGARGRCWSDFFKDMNKEVVQ